ncbi:MAG: DUF1801 domain-containing protein [Bacteroidota bacterium]
MSGLKTKPTEQNVEAYINQIEPDWKRDDCRTLLSLLKRITGENPVMWGDSVVGFGSYHYKYKTGTEGDWYLTGFSPRKQNMTVYILAGFDGCEDLLNKIGKHKKSTGCLYFKRLSDINIDILEDLVIRSVDTLKTRYSEYN